MAGIIGRRHKPESRSLLDRIVDRLRPDTIPPSEPARGVVPDVGVMRDRHGKVINPKKDDAPFISLFTDTVVDFFRFGGPPPPVVDKSEGSAYWAGNDPRATTCGLKIVSPTRFKDDQGRVVESPRNGTYIDRFNHRG